MAARDPPYIVLLGEVGSGKSSVVEKLTGETGRSSDSRESKTRNSESFYSYGNRLIVSDTPGSNASSDTFEQNMWIAAACNFMPVSKIFIVVDGTSGRNDGIISGIREFSDRFVELDEDPLGVIVTHMDNVAWPAEDIKSSIEKILSMHDVVFFDKNKTCSESLISSILGVCGEKKLDLSINHENFLRIFPKLHKNTPRELLKFCNREVKNFRKKNEDFQKKRDNFEEKDKVDLVFEFQAFMKQDIVEIQQRMAEENNLTFYGEKEKMYNEVAYVQNLTNQLCCILSEVRLEGLAFQKDHAGPLRQCPHCKQVWTKVQGCDGETRCGERPTAANDLRKQDYGQMATFTFKWDPNEKDLDIIRRGTKSARQYSSTSKENAGCGKSITWNEMATVQPPAEFSSTRALVNTLDVAMLPDRDSTRDFNREFDETLQSFQSRIKLGPRQKQ